MSEKTALELEMEKILNDATTVQGGANAAKKTAAKARRLSRELGGALSDMKQGLRKNSREIPDNLEIVFKETDKDGDGFIDDGELTDVNRSSPVPLLYLYFYLCLYLYVCSTCPSSPLDGAGAHSCSPASHSQPHPQPHARIGFQNANRQRRHANKMWDRRPHRNQERQFHRET